MVKLTLTSVDDGSELRGEITATEGKRTVATLRFADYADYRGGRTCQITWIEVAAEERRNGLATQMVARLRKELPASRPAQFFLNEQGRALKDAIYDRYATPEEGND